MKPFLILMLGFCWLVTTSFHSVEMGRMNIIVKNVEKGGGTVRMVFYVKPELFLDKNGFAYKKILPSVAGSMQFLTDPLPYGRYAIAVYQDINDNHIMDRSFLGYPTEPYGFANNVSAKWSVPSFHEVSVQLNKPQLDLTIELHRW